MTAARARRRILTALMVVGCSASLLSAAGPSKAVLKALPKVLRGAPKATAPVDLELITLKGGGPGEETTVLLWAEPEQVAGRLDLELKVPEGVRLISGSTAESSPVDGSTRLIQVVIELPIQGAVRLVGAARWYLPGGQVWTKAVILDLPTGRQAAPKMPLPLTELPDGGYRVDLRSGGAP